VSSSPINTPAKRGEKKESRFVVVVIIIIARSIDIRG